MPSERPAAMRETELRPARQQRSGLLPKRPEALKIGLVLDDSLDTPDGVQQYVLAVGRWLATEGHDVHYLVGETSQRDLRNLHSLGRNIKVRFNQNRMSIPLPVSPRKIRALLTREQFDVLHIQTPYSPMLGARIVRAAGPQTAVIGTFHVAPHSRLVYAGNRVLAAVVRRSLRRFDEMIYVSAAARTFGRRTFGVDGPIVPNAVDLSRFFGAKPFRKYMDARHTVVFLGRLVERKGCQHLLAAVRYMRDRHLAGQPFRVVVCGKGPLGPRLEQYVQENNLADVVEFTGFIDEADKPRYLASADLVVYPSTGGESFGIVLIEAMAASGGAVLAGDNPGYASVFAGHPEALFDPHDAQALAAKLARYLNGDALRARAAAWQQDDVRQYDISTVGEQIMGVYRAALARRRA